jgi:hypothetical protein
MFAKTHFAAIAATFVAIAAASPADAAEVNGASYLEYGPSQTARFMSTLSRQEVRDAAIAARAAGSFTEGEYAHTHDNFVSLKTRAQVKAEAIEALRLSAVGRTEQKHFLTVMQLESIEMAGLSTLAVSMAAR